MSAIEVVRSTLARGGELIGTLCWWTLSEVRVARAHLEAVWMAAGLDPFLLPEPPTPEKALKLAARQAQLGRPDLLVRLGKEDEREVVFAVVRERHLSNGNLDYVQEARVVLVRTTGDLASDDPHHDVVAAMQTGYRELLHTHQSDDVRRAIMRVLDRCASVTLRESGGVYWVPAQFSTEVRRLQNAIEQVGSSKMQLLPVHRSADAERTLGEVARGSIEGEIASLAAELEAFLAAPPSRTSTLTNRLEAFEQLKARGQLYSSVLHVSFLDLEDKLAALTQSVEQMLDSRAEAA